MDTGLLGLMTAQNVAVALDNSAVQHNGKVLGPRPLPVFMSLLQKYHQTAPNQAASALSGLQKMQKTPFLTATQTRPIAARAGRATLLDYSKNTNNITPPVVFIPSLINPANILDLTEQRSLLNWLQTQGLRPFLVDWGSLTPEYYAHDIGDHVRLCLSPLFSHFSQPVHLVGYCLGGTMALALAALLPVASITLIASPWHFSGYPDATRMAAAQLWARAKPIVETLGYMPLEILQLLFWQLDPEGTVQKYAHFDTLDMESEDAQLFRAMEQWANSGAPLSASVARELFEDFIARDKTGKEQWQLCGKWINPKALPCPMLDIVSRTDRITPAATSIGNINRLELNLGHVGMITGSRAQQQLWHPLKLWLSRD